MLAFANGFRYLEMAFAALLVGIVYKPDIKTTVKFEISTYPGFLQTDVASFEDEG